MRIIGSLLAVCVAFTTGFSTQAKDDDWAEYRTRNFILRTDADEERARTLITNLEKYRVAVSLLTQIAFDGDHDRPLLIYGYDRISEYHKRHDRSRSTAGFYVQRPDGAVSVLSLEEPKKIWQQTGQRVIFHEYTHHLLHQYSPVHYPRWYDEGFAEYLATMTFRDNLAVIGAPPNDRVGVLKSPKGWLTVQELLESKAEYLNVVGGNSTSRGWKKARNARSHQYAQGWLLTHFLHNSSQYREALPRYLAALDGGATDLEAAFEASFGTDYKTLEKDVLRYWYDRKLKLSGISLAGHMAEVEVSRRKISDAEARVLHFEANIQAGSLEDLNINKAKKAITAALEAQARPSDMLYALGTIARFEAEYETARKLAARMLVLDPEDARALTLDAEVQFHALEEDRHTDETLSAARQQAIRAVKADPTFVPALLAYTEHYLVDGVEVTDAALQAIDSAVFLRPDVPDVRLQRAEMLAKAGRFDDAKVDLRQLISWAHSDAARKGYTKRLEKIEAMEAKAAKPPVSGEE